ncbi:MAG: N-acetylglucosamine-6-phosphate deacetylase [Inquilinus sp.]|nr:N-acetylglucosamine-6-phosphate deacetylase [Inquilinus sp.]
MTTPAPEIALTGCRIFTGDETLDRHAVVIGGGAIVDVVVETSVPSAVKRRRLDGGLLAPGFVDLQVNGGGGVMFNHSLSVDGIRTIGEAHRRFGTTGFLPTLITDKRGTIPAAMVAVRDAIAQGVPGVLGVHIEGPFINVERRGVHSPEAIRPIELADIAELTSLGVGRTLVTLAPELVPHDLLLDLRNAGLHVAAGHTAASYEEIIGALSHGISGFTHLFNAMTPMESRAPGVVGAALDDPDSWCGLIVDGHHVSPATLRVAIAAKPRGKMFLVTDAMATVGAEERSFDLYDQTITEIDGRLSTADNRLAGSSLDMASAVRNTVQLLRQPLDEALRMASLYPASFIGLGDRIGRIAPGYRADLVLLDDEINVLDTWIGGNGR